MLDGLVEECIARYGGGRAYFDQLDESLRGPLFFEALTETVDEMYGKLPPLVVTGKFGEAYRDWLLKSGREWYAVLNFEGGLRHQPADHGTTIAGLLPQGYVFLDDSFYRGRTLAHISTALFKGGSKVLSTHVIYDGSTYPGLTPDIALYTYRNRTGKGQ